MKICSNPNCPQKGELQELNKFYKDKSHKDGYSSRCKTCVNAYWQSGQGRAVKLKAVKNYLSSEKGKTTRKKVDSKRYQDQHIKHLARRTVMLAIRSGEIPPAKKLTCAICGQKAKEYHHHNGYLDSHWLDVIPLCDPCHKREHVIS